MTKYTDFELDLQTTKMSALSNESTQPELSGTEPCGSGSSSIIPPTSWSVNNCFTKDCSMRQCGFVYSLLHWNECKG